ncbi:hypothetical protein GL503_07710 [Salmonella enterica]|nr:hypothetical protein [Salmonella enterica]
MLLPLHATFDTGIVKNRQPEKRALRSAVVDINSSTELIKNTKSPSFLAFYTAYLFFLGVTGVTGVTRLIYIDFYCYTCIFEGVTGVTLFTYPVDLNMLHLLHPYFILV